jgi:hypothetical protein
VLKEFDRLKSVKIDEFDLHEFDAPFSDMEVCARHNNLKETIKTIERQFPSLSDGRKSDISERARKYPMATISNNCFALYSYWKDQHDVFVNNENDDYLSVDSSKFLSMNLACVYQALYACHVLNNLHLGKQNVTLGEITIDDGYYKETDIMREARLFSEQYLTEYAKILGNTTDLSQIQKYPLDYLSFGLDRMNNFFVFLYRKKKDNVVEIPKQSLNYVWHLSIRLMYISSYIYKGFVDSRAT